DIRGRDLEQLRDVPHRVRRDVSLLPLYEIERRKHGRTLPIGRISRDDLVEARAVLGRVHERRSFLLELARGAMEGRVVCHLGMKRHRSTSPMTTSIDPMTAITSAMSPPTIMRSSAWHARSDGARDLMRHGRFVPSATT